MKLKHSILGFCISVLAAGAFAGDGQSVGFAVKPYTPGTTMNQSIQAGITPDDAIAILQAGNARFVSGKPLKRDLKLSVKQTALGQYPFASVLSCIDSRTVPELVFDQGIGDIFNARVAGNVVNADILGSFEYAAKVAGSRVIVVLGHTSCGAIKGACDGVQMGNLTGLLSKISPVIGDVVEVGERNSKNHSFVEKVAEMNVDFVIQSIRKQSPILKELEDAGKIKIVGAVYDTSTGKVNWR